MDELVESVYGDILDEIKFEDVIDKLSLIFIGNGGYILDFSELDKIKNYVIKYEGDYDLFVSDLNF